ncbi:hypothetical protein FFL34_06125 [Lentibacillus cibarius]|uniref:Uncharacterized protein n=1 Tax=Lentibacillus cibarius TaxID=2583219 RepID=A0A5S3QPD2_9BACI|nr:hypothetical protein FFL34_06125 [Lentibacillus cibarius]
MVGAAGGKVTRYKNKGRFYYIWFITDYRLDIISQKPSSKKAGFMTYGNY